MSWQCSEICDCIESDAIEEGTSPEQAMGGDCVSNGMMQLQSGVCGEGGENKSRNESSHVFSGDKSMNKGLISEDRSNKATLLLTIPCSLLSRLQRIYRSQCVD